MLTELKQWQCAPYYDDPKRQRWVRLFKERKWFRPRFWSVVTDGNGKPLEGTHVYTYRNELTALQEYYMSIRIWEKF